MRRATHPLRDHRQLKAVKQAHKQGCGPRNTWGQRGADQPQLPVPREQRAASPPETRKPETAQTTRGGRVQSRFHCRCTSETSPTTRVPEDCKPQSLQFSGRAWRATRLPSRVLHEKGPPAFQNTLGVRLGDSWLGQLSGGSEISKQTWQMPTTHPLVSWKLWRWWAGGLLATPSDGQGLAGPPR